MKIVVSSDPNNLKRFLQNQNDSYFYISIDPISPDFETILREKHCKKIDVNEGSDGIDFRKEYVDFIGKLNHDYRSIYWWATTLSYKGTFASSPHKDIFNYYCIDSLIKKKNCNYVIINNDPILNSSIKNNCERSGIECRLLDSARPLSRISHYRRCVLGAVYFLCEGWVKKLWTSICLSRSIKKSLKKDVAYYVLRSYVDERSFAGAAGYKDLYFGRLPEYLNAKDKKFIILTGMLTNYKNLCRRLKDIRHIMVIPQEYFAGYLDFLKVSALTFINKVRVRKPILFCGLEVTEFVEQSIRKDYEFGEIQKNLMYFYYIKNLSKKMKIDRFIYPFENQAWEKISILAVRKYSPSSGITGYAHSSFRPNLFGYSCSDDEKGVIPFPDKIVTVGKELKNIVEGFGNYPDKTQISMGCALRYEYFFNENTISRNKNGKILAALSMDFNRCLRLLRFLIDSFTGRDHHEIILRSHPFLPVEAIIQKYDLKLNNNFQISKNLEIRQDLDDTSMLIYTDTTSCMEALMRGTPVINIDFKEEASPDPLFNLNSLRWVVSSKKDMLKAVEHIYGMDDEEYARKNNAASSYLKKYFYPVQENYLKEFIS